MEVSIEQAPPAPKDMFAVIKLGAHQYKVTPGDYITVEKIPVDVGTQISLDKVLLVGGKKFTSIGRPLVHGARVIATVEEQTRAEKVIAFKFKKRKNYKRWKGHSQLITVMRIDDIIYELPEVDESKEKITAVE